MSIHLNHIVACCKDQEVPSKVVAAIPRLPTPAEFSHFDVMELRNSASLDLSQSLPRLLTRPASILTIRDSKAACPRTHGALKSNPC